MTDSETKMNGYLAFYQGKQIEVFADTLLQAKDAAVTSFHPPKSKRHLVHVHLCETNVVDGKGEQVVHTIDS